MRGALGMAKLTRASGAMCEKLMKHGGRWDRKQANDGFGSGCVMQMSARADCPLFLIKLRGQPSD